MKKTHFLSLGLIASAVSTIAVITAGGNSPLIRADDAPCAHVGNHYSAYAATLTEAGTAEYYACCKCHEIILGSEHTEGDGTWTDNGQAALVGKTHKAYLEPTVTAADVSASIEELNDAIAVGRTPTASDALLKNRASSLLTAYLGKEGTSEDDISNIQTYRGAENTLNTYGMSKLASASGSTGGRVNVYNPAKTTIVRNLVDEDTGMGYVRVTPTEALSAYSTAAFIYGGVFSGITTDAQFLVRTNFDTSFHTYSTTNTSSTRSESATSVSSGVWTTVTIPYSHIQKIQEGVAEGRYNTFSLSINTAFAEGQTVEIGDIYASNSIDLPSYSLFSNEGYSSGWQFGGLTGTMSTNLHGKGWFAGTATPTEHPSYRDYFLETKISNNSGADKTSEDLLVSYYYGGLYFGTGSYTFSETVTEVFFMVYSNEEVSIKYSNFGGIVTTSSRKTVVRESKIYKGWNAIHVDIEGSKAYSIKGHAFQIVPEVWSTTLELTMSAMFYKVAA